MPCTLDDVAATAIETKSAAVLIDLPGPHPVVIEAGVIEELAKGHRLVELPDGGFGWMYLDDAASDDAPPNEPDTQHRHT